MNATDTNTSGAKTLSPAESQMLQSSLFMMAQARGDHPDGPPALTSTPTMAKLYRAFRRRWQLGLGIAAAATFIAIVGVFVAMPPKYNVQMRLRVVARQGGPEDVEFPIFKANMEAMVRSPLV